MKKLNGLLVLLALASILIVACGSNGSSSTSNTQTPGTQAPSTQAPSTQPPAAQGPNTVGLAASTFAQTSITIKKGENITLVNQTSGVHIIANGTWQGNTPDPQTETGAPVVSNAMFSSQNQSMAVGPFNTAGTFHYYCSVHPAMNLTVIVQ